MKKCLLLSKKFSAFLMVFALLFVSAFSVIVFVKGATVPENEYTVFQDFEEMTLQTELEAFFPYFVFDEDTTMTMELSQDGGYNGSKAAKFDYGQIVSWVNIGDKEDVTNRYHAEDDGFSFWINTSRPIRVRLDVMDSPAGTWLSYQGEMITLTAGQQFVQIPWTTVKTTGAGRFESDWMSWIAQQGRG